MTGNVISKRYASALYLIASEKKIVDDVLEELKNLSLLIEDNADFNQLIKNPLIHKNDKEKVFDSLAKAGYLSDLLLVFMKLLVEKNRLSEIEAIKADFEDTYMENSGKAVADVRSVIDLSEDIKNDLSKKLSEMTGKKVAVHTEKDVSLLGGFLAKIKSIQFDASVKEQLERLKAEMVS